MLPSSSPLASPQIPPQPLAYPFAEPPAPGRMLEVAPGIFWLRMPLPFALDHINLWLLADCDAAGAAGWTLIDTGYGSEAVRAIWEELLAGLSAPLLRIIATHFHPDHVGLASWLREKTGASIHMSAAEYLTAHAVFNESSGHGSAAMLRQFAAHGLDSERLEELRRRANAYARGVPALPDTYCRLIGGDWLTIGGRRWQVRIGHGHSPEHVSLYSPDAGVLVSGDMLLPKISTNISVFAVTPDADALAQYLASIERDGELSASTLVLPSHGLPFTGVHARIAAQQAHHAERLEVLAAACSEPQSAASLLATLFPRALDTHQVMFAMGEAIAHLNHLEYAQRLVRSTDAGAIRFRRKN